MDIAQLGISVDSRQVKAATGDLDGLTGAGKRAETETDRLSAATKTFGSVLAGVGFVAAASQAIKLADAYNKLSARVGMATNDLKLADERMEQIFATAQSVNAPLQEMGDLFTKMSPSVTRMGGSFKETNAIAEAFALTLKNSGAGAQQTAAAILQFGQAMDSGRLNGEEFGAMAEYNGQFLDLLAKNIGVSRGELRKMSQESKLTSDILGNTLLLEVENLRDKFQQLPVSVEDAAVRVGNSLQLMAAKSDIVNATSSVLSETLMLVSETMDGVSLATEQAATESEKLASENRVQTWAESGARLLAILMDSVDGVKFAFIAVGKTLGALAAAAVTSLSGIGTGISGIFNAIKSGDFAAAGGAVSSALAQIGSTKAIWSAYTADINAAAGAVGKHQAALDRTLSGVQTKVKPATDGFKKLAGATTDSGKASEKAAKAAARAAEQAADAYSDIERSLSKQLMTEEELTTAQKVAMDLTDKRYKHLSDRQKANLIALAKEVDAFKAQEKLLKDMAASAQELAEADTKRQQSAVDAAYQGRKAVEDQLAKLQEEAATYGMTETEIQRYLLAKAEEKLALEQGGEARQGVIDQLQIEIEKRKELVSATAGSEMRKATDELGGRVQDTLEGAIKDGLASSNPIKGFAKSLGNSVKNALYDAVAKGLAARLTGALGFGGASGTASAGGFDISSLLSLGGSAAGGGASAGSIAGISGSSVAAYAALIYGSIDFAKGVTKAFKSGDIADVWKGTQSAQLINQLFGGKGGAKSGGNYNAAFVGGMATNENFFGGYTPSQADAQLKTAVNDFYKNYTQTVKDLGGVAKDLTLNLGFDTDPAGSAGNRLSAQVAVGAVTAGERELWQQSVLSMVSESVGEIPEAISLATGKMLLAALKESELPAEYARVFNGVDIKSATQEQINAMQNALAAIRTLNTAFENFGKTLPQLAGLTYEAKEAIATFGGGLEAFSGSLNSYIDAYYSDAEKASMATKQLQSQFSQLNIVMPSSTAAFRKMVEAQDLTTEGGRKTYAALISLSGAFATVADAAAQAAAEQAEREAAARQERSELELRLLEAQGNAAEVLTRNRQAELAAVDATNRALLQSIYAEQDRKAAIQAADSAAQASLQSLRTAVDAEKNSISTSLQATINGLENRAKAEKIAADAIYKAQTAAIKTARDAQKAVFDAAKEAAQKSISALNSVFSLVSGKQVDTADSVAASLSGRQSALASLSSIGAGIRGGADAGQFQDQLASAMGVIAQPSEQLYSSFTDYQFDQRRANAEITSIEKGTKSQIDLAELTLQTMIEADKRAEALAYEQINQLDRAYEASIKSLETQLEQDKLLATEQAERDISALDQQLAAAEKQYSALVGIDNGVRSLEYAMRDVSTKLADFAASKQAAVAVNAAIDGSHRNGLAEVPFDGYRAELHAGERVLTAQQADSSDKMAVDIAEMRREMASAMLAIADNTRRTARLQERWDGDGLPDARGY